MKFDGMHALFVLATAIEARGNRRRVRGIGDWNDALRNALNDEQDYDHSTFGTSKL